MITLPSDEQKFIVKNCSLAAIATGEQASSLVELRDKLAIVDEGSIYYHFWGGRMNPQCVSRQHHNDLSKWVYQRLHDNILAERLSIIDPTEFDNLEALRQEILETIERRLDDYETILWTKKEDRFRFIRCIIIVFDSDVTITHPEDLASVIQNLPPSSIFNHFIEARVRTAERIDDFSAWLKLFGNKYYPLIEKIQAIDPYFLTLTQLRDTLIKTIQSFFHEKG